jgi:hypothetical protein
MWMGLSAFGLTKRGGEGWSEQVDIIIDLVPYSPGDSPRLDFRENGGRFVESETGTMPSVWLAVLEYNGELCAVDVVGEVARTNPGIGLVLTAYIAPQANVRWRCILTPSRVRGRFESHNKVRADLHES